MFSWLSDHGVLGLNARNLLYIKPWNPRRAIAFADDKLKTKAFLRARGIPVAKFFGKISSRRELREFDFEKLPEECVLKPNFGFGGEGILILKGRSDGKFLVQGSDPLSERDLRNHIEDILDGKFSVNGQRDTAFFERILEADDCFSDFRPAGLPDIRIVVFNLVPVMAMLRIPTAESGGKANVHLGGIGIGIDIAKGITTHAVQRNRILRLLPHGGSPAGISIPRWEELLLIASRIQHMTNIGYIAVDLTLDREQGPVLLEVNARAGLMVQVANLAALRARLERVEGLTVGSPEKGVRIAQDLFGDGPAKRRPRAEGRSVLGTEETLIVMGDGMSISVPCLIAPIEERTVFSKELLEELLRTGAVEIQDAKESTYRMKFILGGKKIQTVVHSGGEIRPGIRALVGKRDLTGFLIDPMKNVSNKNPRVLVRDDLRAMDRFLAQADRRLLLLKGVKPTNARAERDHVVRDLSYNPHFLYQDLPSDIEDLERRLCALTPDDAPLGILYERKRRELLMRISLLRARGDAVRFTEVSKALYGAPSALLIAHASAVLHGRIACDLPSSDGESMSAEETATIFRETLAQYALHDWRVVVKSGVIADCTVGSRRVYLRSAARFTKSRIAALIAHEIETHALTQENGRHQPYELFEVGCAQYLDTQEGLAVYCQRRALSPYHDKLFDPARNVLAVAFALDHSFADTLRYLKEELAMDMERAVTKTFQLKRGLGDTALPGAFTKDLVYFRGLCAIEEFMKGGGDLRRLYVGKIAIEDLEVIESVPGLKPPLIVPMWMRS